MGSVCSRKTAVADPRSRSNMKSESGFSLGSTKFTSIHLQNKKELRDTYMKEGMNQRSMHELTADNIWGTTTAFEDIRNVYFFDKKKLGEGHFGVVKRAKLIADPKRNYAVKSISKQALKNDVHLLKRELEILKSVDHPHIAKFYECYQDEAQIHFVLEYCSGSVLVDRLIDLKKLSEEEVKSIMFQVLQVVSHLHARRICHRDIKPDNLIYANKKPNSDLKMIDFGLSRPISSEKLQTIVGTPYYVAPEVIKGDYSLSCDYWSLGVMMYMLLCGKPPFFAKLQKKLFYQICKGKFTLTDPAFDIVSPQAKEIISQFLVIAPDKRLTARDALDHPWFHELNIEQINTGKLYVTPALLHRLIKFSTTSALQREVIKLMVKIFDYTEEVRQLRYVFFCADYLNNGTISDKELKAFFQEYNITLSKKEIQNVVSGLELRSKGCVTYSEFVAGAVDPQFYSNPSNLKIMFKRFDIDESKKITAKNIMNCFARFGFVLSKQEAELLINTFNPKIKGIVSQQEFIEAMTLLGLPN